MPLENASISTSPVRYLHVALTAAALALAAAPVLAAFPGANGRIVFDREDVEVFSILPDGTGETNLTDDPADDDAPAWSPDGTRIAFDSDRDGSGDIWVMDADGQNLAQVTSGPDSDDHPAWSPDGTRIVFQRERSGDDDVWIVNVDGSGEVNLTDDPDEDDKAPAFSPDGTRIAFDRDGDIRLMNADGTGKTELTTSGPIESSPNWSPDGTRIAFDSVEDGDLEIVVVNVDGSGRVRLTFNDEDDRHPAWSPDGTKIAFEAVRSGDDQIHVIDADGGNEIELTDFANDDDDRHPDWQPLPVATTTTTTTPVTTTTVPGGGTPASGRRLILKDDPGKPRKRALVLLAKDPAIGRGAENDGTGDPVAHGGFLKVVSSTGDGFNTTYDLPADRWRYKGKRGKSKGYKLTGSGPIRAVLVKLGKTLKVVARGDALGHSLGADPGPVHVALGLGSERYCFSFGGQTKFKAGKQYVAKKAAAPGACAALVPACGDRLREPGEVCPTLEGPEDALAIDAVFDLFAAPDVTDAERDADAGGRALVRTRIEIAFLETATVGQVNALLDRVGGSIVGMLDDVAQLVVLIPDPGSVAALDALVVGFEEDPVVRFVRKAYELELGVLPPDYAAPLTSPSAERLDHHLAIRGASAWNARAARSGEVPVLVMDWFGNQAPDPTLVDVSGLPAGDFGNVGLGVEGSHGYHVLGIVAASFGGAGGPGQVTGLVPGTVPMRVVDRRVVDALSADVRAIQILKSASGNAVFSTSIIYTACNLPELVARVDALSWVEKVRAAGLEDRTLHLTCAGNVNPACAADVDARKGGPYAAAALLPLTSIPLGTPVTNLANVLAIENAVNTAGPAFSPQCLSSAAKRPGQLAGIGTNVFSLTDRTGSAGDKSGCSMATPQVAGLAAYLWSIAPAMTRQQVAGVLQATAVPLTGTGGGPGCAAVDPKPVVDAYAAVLALDAASLPTPATAPVRHAIINVDDTGIFDEDDLFEWVNILIDPNTGSIQEPSDPEYQRYDLNGDGFTGGASRRRPFDLDRAGSTRFGASQLGQVTQGVEGISVPFDESGLTDLDILCYYAYSDLYEGSEQGRRDLLGTERCSRVTMIVDFPSMITPGTPETLRVTVGRDGLQGSDPLPGIHIELSPAGGTAIPQSGTTDAQGEFTAEAELAPDSSSIEIVVQALDAPGGQVLAEDVVLAVGPCTDGPTDVEIDFGNGEDNPTTVGPVLQNGLDYRLTVSGTFTVNSTQQWQNGVCKGAPAAGVGGPTGIDAEFFFAVPNGSALCGDDFQCCPNHTSKFQISLDGGGGFDHVEPVSPAFDGSHVYEYVVRGEGLPVHVRLEEDSNRGDDYGVLDVHIACADSPPTTTTTTTTTTTSTTSTTGTTSTTVSTVTTTTATTTTAVSTTTIGGTSTTTTTLIGIPVIPYRRYAASGPDGPVVTLTDEFATETANLGSVILELPPVEVDGQVPFDPFTHQTCYAHPGGTLDTCIDIEDGFGFAPLRVGDPIGVCVPEVLPIIGVDTFKCYAATGAALDVEVALVDEFQSQTVTVGAPELLCTPVSIDEAPLVNPLRYLVCYATTPPGVAGGQIEVENTLHPDPISVDVGLATGLCVPAVRQLVPSCQLCGNGVLDGAEECDDADVQDGDGCSGVCRFELECTCDGVPVPPPNEEGCATLADCGSSCTACSTGGGTCGCQ